MVADDQRMGDDTMTTPETTEHAAGVELPLSIPANMPARSATQVKALRARSARLDETPQTIAPASGMEHPTRWRLPWLDSQTAAEVDAIVEALARTQPDVLAVIVFGSVARHDERPLTDSEPSDLDLLVVVTPGMTEEAAVAIHDTIGMAGQPFGYTPRTIEPLLVEADLKGWDAAFVANILHDGVVLWARESLPEPFTSQHIADAHGNIAQ